MIMFYFTGDYRMSKTLTIPSHDGPLFSAYLALPKAEKSNGSLMIVLQEIFGVNHAIRQVCDDFAKLGYTACAPDMFWRIKPYLNLGYDESDREVGMACYQQFTIDLALQDINSTIQELKKRKDLSESKVIVLGFCLGGKLAYLTAANHPVDAAICYYGVGLHELLDKAKNITCPIQFHFGGDDANITTKHVDALRETFKNKTNSEIYVYPDAEHAFANPDRPSYHKKSADEAHARAVALLKKLSN
jgi:carboxymethylenebutenolidase